MAIDRQDRDKEGILSVAHRCDGPALEVNWL